MYGVLALPKSLPPERRSSTTPGRAINPFGQVFSLLQLAPLRLLLGSIALLNLAFSGLQTNFPLFSQARFGWDSWRNGLFFAYVGVYAVFVQGILYAWIQPRLGEKRLGLIGLGCMAGAGGYGPGAAWLGAFPGGGAGGFWNRDEHPPP